VTSANFNLLLPYHLRITPRPKRDPGGYDQLRMTVGNDFHQRIQRPVRCTQITLTVPNLNPPTTTQPISIRTRVTPVTGRDQGRRWWIYPNTTDPTHATFSCVPENTAHFDGTWSITFTIELDRSLPDPHDITITEDAAPNEFTHR
jgi:hypothetical protein